MCSRHLKKEEPLVKGGKREAPDSPTLRGVVITKPFRLILEPSIPGPVGRVVIIAKSRKICRLCDISGGASTVQKKQVWTRSWLVH